MATHLQQNVKEAATAPADARPRVLRHMTGWPAAGVVLALFYALMMGSAYTKSMTCDEVVHATAGHTYWRMDDYRINPENGNLPQRVAGLGMMTADYRFPSVTQPEPAGIQAMWQASFEWGVGDHFFYWSGNDGHSILMHGRFAMGLLAVALGALVYGVSRHYFGPGGGMVALVLYALCPTVLGNGPLVTSDTAGALFFFLSAWCLWVMLHRLTPVTVLLSSLAMGGLFVAKMSGVLIVPMAVLMIALRLVRGGELRARLLKPLAIRCRWQQALAFGGAVVVHAAVALVVIWASYGFRYEMFADASPQNVPPTPWESLLDRPGFITDTINFARENRLAPESYLYGYAHVYKHSQMRASFMDGEFGLLGWKGFFPYTFLVKTPLTILVAIALAAAAMIAVLRRAPQPMGAALDAVYRATPLWLLILVYWGTIIFSHLNIGHRHIMPVYAPTLALAGACIYWLRDSRLRAMKFITAGVLALLAAEVLWYTPHHLAYFNQLAGGPSNGWRRLIDSSLDWGQDLRGIQQYLRANGLTSGIKPVYVSYFGTARFTEPVGAKLLYGNCPDWSMTNVAGVNNPYRPPMGRYADIQVVPTPPAGPETSRVLADCPDYELLGTAAQGTRAIYMKKASCYEIKGGTFIVSASMLQPVLYFVDRAYIVDKAELRQKLLAQLGREPVLPPDWMLVRVGPWGPWNPVYEMRYGELRQNLAPLLGATDPAVRMQMLSSVPLEYWQHAINEYHAVRMARLTAYLRQRQPDDTIGYSVLVYHLSDAEVRQALDEPWPLGDPKMEQDVVPALLREVMRVSRQTVKGSP
jgi:4-amino-4-deoxy-L-arabinose transferase-like glycosyltransferase